MLDPFRPNIKDQANLNTYTSEEKARRDAGKRNKDFYYDNQEKYVSTFNIEAKPSILPLARPILDKRTSMLYNKKLTRDIRGPVASVNFLEALYSENDIDNIFLSADLYSELTGTVLLSMVEDTEKTSGYRITLWDGTNISAVSDDSNSSSLAALSLIKEVSSLSKEASHKDNIQVKTVTHQQIWTKERVFYYEGFTEKNSVDNEYKRIPFSVIKGKEVPNQFYGFSPATSISLMNATINQLVSDLTYTIKLQSANPIVLTGFQGGESLIVQPGKAINLPVGADAKILPFKPQIEDTLNTIKFIEQKIYETSSVPEVSIVGSEGSSGRELLVRWYPLVQVFLEKAVRYQKYELEAANNFLFMAGFEPIQSIHVNYDKNSILPLNPEEDKLKEDVSLNLTNPAKILRERDPHLTEQEAAAIIKKNKETNSGLENQDKNSNKE